MGGDLKTGPGREKGEEHRAEAGDEKRNEKWYGGL
jgi:hypothetical protein